MGLPFLSAQSDTPGIRPACKVSEVQSGGGGFGGLMDMAAALLGDTPGDPWAEHLLRADIVIACAPQISYARLVLARGSNAPDASIGDKLKVELGYADELTSVIQGEVSRLRYLADGKREIGLSSSAIALARRRQIASFEGRSFGDLARQWAGEAELTPGSITDGPRYPFLAIDDTRSLWEWLAEFGRHTGTLVYVDGDGQLQCKSAGGPVIRNYSYGQDLLYFDVNRTATYLGGATVSGEGAAGSQGSQAWHWLSKSRSAISASAGTGDPKHLYQSGALRDQGSARDFAQALVDGASRAAVAIVARVPGSANLLPGQVFQINGCPGGDGDGGYIAQTVRHRYDKRGFISTVAGVSS